MISEVRGFFISNRLTDELLRLTISLKYILTAYLRWFVSKNNWEILIDCSLFSKPSSKFSAYMILLFWSKIVLVQNKKMFWSKSCFGPKVVIYMTEVKSYLLNLKSPLFLFEIHSCEFPIGYYCHMVRVGWTFTIIVVDHTIL